jgi:hypothetical protein
MKTLFFILLFSFPALTIKSQIIEKERNLLEGKAFPSLIAETLTGKIINFPKDTKGKATIICIAFSDKAQPIADEWTKAIIAKQPEKDFNYFEIPMLKKGLKIMRGMIDGGMRKGIPKNLHNNVATYYGTLTDYKAKLIMPNDDNVYLFMLDSEGKIVVSFEGNMTVEKLAQIFNSIN